MELATAIKNEPLPIWLAQFVNIYQQLSTDNLALLHDIYAEDITFIDPMHHIQGFEKLEQYFASLYTNLTSCEFHIEDVFYQDSSAAIYWTMRYCHPKLNKGKPVTVQGHSKLSGRGNKVVYHRDYLDLGAMIYENIPVVGGVVRFIKHWTKA